MSAATSVPVPTFEVDAASVMSTIRELASARYDGRLAGTDGNWAAVAYVADMWTITTWLSSPDREACGSFRGLVLETDISSSGYFPVQLSIWDVEDEADDDADDSSEEWAWPMIFSCDVLTFAELLRARNEGMLVRLSADFAIEQVSAANVVSLLRGSAVAPEDAHTIIGAHLDHVGSNMNGTYNLGALDNASGIAAILEVAGVLTSSAEPQPKSVVFIAFNGEEQEMQGSAYYARNPCYPLDGAIMINIDCV